MKIGGVELTAAQVTKLSAISNPTAKNIADVLGVKEDAVIGDSGLQNDKKEFDPAKAIHIARQAVKKDEVAGGAAAGGATGGGAAGGAAAGGGAAGGAAAGGAAAGGAAAGGAAKVTGEAKVSEQGSITLPEGSTLTGQNAPDKGKEIEHDGVKWGLSADGKTLTFTSSAVGTKTAPFKVKADSKESNVEVAINEKKGFDWWDLLNWNKTLGRIVYAAIIGLAAFIFGRQSAT